MPTSQLLLKITGIKAYVRRLRHFEQGRVFYRAAPAVTRAEVFTVSFKGSSLHAIQLPLMTTKEYYGPFLSRILTEFDCFRNLVPLATDFFKYHVVGSWSIMYSCSSTADRQYAAWLLFCWKCGEYRNSSKIFKTFEGISILNIKFFKIVFWFYHIKMFEKKKCFHNLSNVKKSYQQKLTTNARLDQSENGRCVLTKSMYFIWPYKKVKGINFTRYKKLGLGALCVNRSLGWNRETQSRVLHFMFSHELLLLHFDKKD